MHYCHTGAVSAQDRGTHAARAGGQASQCLQGAASHTNQLDCGPFAKFMFSPQKPASSSQQQQDPRPFAQFMFSPSKHAHSRKQQPGEITAAPRRDGEGDLHCLSTPPSSPSQHAHLRAASPATPPPPCKRPLHSLLQSPSKRCNSMMGKNEDSQAGVGWHA